ncbi:MAG: shikimate dehydrogenase [Dysgonamonadaceae bacterium]|jgi:shikimate dehydrogenase|nr:shikimate dehydrogenase [Dysgonamonadaceae bacterium]
MDKYGLIGYPLKHSFSMNFFNEKFVSEKVDAKYINFEIPSIKDFPEIIKFNPELKGLNVTIPYKEQIIPYLDDLGPNAKVIGAVNVIKFIREKGKKLKLIGYNSDILGFKQSIEPLLEKHHRKALILGTGGSSKAIFHGLKQLGLESVFVSRTPAKGLSYREITPEIMAEYTVIVNCTPVGMFPKMDVAPNIPYEQITDKHLLYDLLYNPDETLFLKNGKERGAIVKNGLEMLLLQAFESWNFWQSKI